MKVGRFGPKATRMGTNLRLKYHCSTRLRKTRLGVSTFTEQIDRVRAAQYGREAVAIGECGHYRAPSGLKVDIKALLSLAVTGTVSYSPDSPISGANADQHDTIK